jgi:hypothetical protein
VKPDVDTLSTVPDAPPEAGPDRALDPPPPDTGPPPKPLPGCPAVAGLEVELEEVEREEEAIAVPLLLPQAARIAVAARKRKVTLTKVFCESDVRIDIFFPSFPVTFIRKLLCDVFRFAIAFSTLITFLREKLYIGRFSCPFQGNFATKVSHFNM